MKHDEEIMHSFQKLLLSFSKPPSPSRNKDMEISCESAGALVQGVQKK